MTSGSRVVLHHSQVSRVSAYFVPTCNAAAEHILFFVAAHLHNAVVKVTTARVGKLENGRHQHVVMRQICLGFFCAQNSDGVSGKGLPASQAGGRREGGRQGLCQFTL